MLKLCVSFNLAGVSSGLGGTKAAEGRAGGARERNVQLANLLGLLALDHVGNGLASDVAVGDAGGEVSERR